MIVGRDEEQARIADLLESARRGRTGALALVGEPGIGKSALVDAACDAAQGMRVLRATAVEAEAMLPFAGLHLLLGPLLDLVERLDTPQREALLGALALAQAGETDALAVNVATMALLVLAAAERPLLVAVDDAHWLDEPSAGALGFAARRLEGEDLAFLAALRPGRESLGDAFERLELHPLGREDARSVLERRVEPVPAAAAEQLLDVAGGNPLALLELPVALALSEGGGDEPPPERVARAFSVRLDGLSAEAREALALAALEPQPAIVRKASAALGLPPGALEEAESAGLVVLEPDGVVFRHPLVRTLAARAADPGARRSAHRALADALTDERDGDRRAWHLAAAATEPDDDLAAQLEETADRATQRGGNALAARVLERAARLSTDVDGRARRLTAAARASFWAGDVDRGLELAQEALTVAADPLLRVDALLERASIRGTQGAGFEEASFLAGIADIEELDPDRATRLLINVVGWRSQVLDATGAVEVAARLDEVARRGGPWWGPRGRAVAASAHLGVGDTAAFVAVIRELLPQDAVVANMGLDLVWAELYAEARHALETTLREGRASGNTMRVIWNQACLGFLELRQGRLDAARLAATEAITLGEAHGTAHWLIVARGALAGVQAWQGEAEGCRATAREAIAAAREAHSVVDELAAHAAVGLLALGLGAPEEAIDELEPWERRWRDSTLQEPSAVPFVPDLVEALVRVGETDEARTALARFAAAAELSGRRWALAAIERCEGLLADDDGFEARFDRSLELLEAEPLPLERARTALAYGERLRRLGRRREARRTLREAYDAFAAAGATPWVERAAAELRATGETVGPRTVDRRSRLTPQELQITQLVGEGLTNREVAARLYLSPKTIEYHLANAYRKLEIHSRVELVRLLAGGDAPDDA